MVTRRFARIWICFILLTAPVAGAINIDGFMSSLHDRFTNDGSFILDGYDLSGIAISDSGRWLTMVSDNVFLSSNHLFPADNAAVTFYATNDPNGSTVSRTVQSSQQIASSDIRIGVLNSPLPAGYATYDYYTSDITIPNASFLTPVDAFTFGRSPTAFSTSQDMAVGTNKIDLWYPSVTAGGTTDGTISTIVNESGDANDTTYESFLQVGDSGGPLMVATGPNTLTIAGINWWITNSPEELQPGVFRNLNGFSYLGNYDGEITAYISANAIPEPASVSLVIGVICLIILLRARARETSKA